MNIIGLTGMSGAGKSTASDFLRKHGFHVIDCDVIARETITRSPCVDDVNKKFPELFTNGIFDRKKAAAELFSKPERLDRYNKLVFPYVIYSVINLLNVYKKAGTDNLILDAPTLFQSGADDFCNKIIAVTADKSLCVKRITERDSISELAALLRLNNQYNADFFRKNADIVIENNNSKSELEATLTNIKNEFTNTKRS